MRAIEGAVQVHVHNLLPVIKRDRINRGTVKEGRVID